MTLACWEDGKKYSAVDLLKSLDHGGRLSRIVGRFFEGLDVFVTPTIAKPPAPHGEVNQNRAGMTAMEWTRQVFSYVPLRHSLIRPDSRRFPCRCTGVPTACRSVSSLLGISGTKQDCCAWPLSWKRQSRGRTSVRRCMWLPSICSGVR